MKRIQSNHKLSDKSKIEADKFLADHIIVHVKFASPEVEWSTLDARYTFYDQISNLGGTIDCVSKSQEPPF